MADRAASGWPSLFLCASAYDLADVFCRSHSCRSERRLRNNQNQPRRNEEDEEDRRLKIEERRLRSSTLDPRSSTVFALFVASWLIFEGGSRWNWGSKVVWRW